MFHVAVFPVKEKAKKNIFLKVLGFITSRLPLKGT